MTQNIRTTILCITLLVAAPLQARENTDVIVMNNGDRITCEVKGLNGGVLYINPSYILGTISVDWSKVSRLESKQLFLVKIEDGSVYNGDAQYGSNACRPPHEDSGDRNPEKDRGAR